LPELSALAALVAVAERPTRAWGAGRASAAGAVRVSRDVFAHHSEPFLAVNPLDLRNLLGACIAFPAGGESELATYASFDGGETWRSNGALPSSRGGRDPSVAFDSQGVGYVCGNTSGVSVWRTTDGGKSFGARTIVTEVRADHPWLAIGIPTDIIHVVWSFANNTKLGLARSTDGGRNFEQPRVIAQAGGAVTAAPVLAAGKDGVVCAIFGVWPRPTKGPRERRAEISGPVRVVCSTDHGQTFASPIGLGRAAMEMHVPGGASGVAIPTIVADPARDALYAAFVTRQNDAPYSTVVVRASRDRGRTWTKPVRVTPVRRDVFYFQPQLAVDDVGRVAVSAFALERRRVSVALASSAARPLRFSAPCRVAAPFNPARGSLPGGAKHGAWWIGDYQGLAASSPGTFHPFWNDTRTGSLQLFTATATLR
jgi:hypothetical protein